MTTSASAFTFDYKRYEDVADLPEVDQHLLAESLQATQLAYAPYSNFRVGAAVLLEDGTILIGSNQENAAFSMTLCAERVALFAANLSHRFKKIKAIAITACNEKGICDISPCGACRQVMVEFEKLRQHNMRVLIRCSDHTIVTESARCLLPFAFDSLDKS